MQLKRIEVTDNECFAVCNLIFLTFAVTIANRDWLYPDSIWLFIKSRIGEFASKIDWTDSDQVAIAQQTRQEYHAVNEAKLQALYNQGYTIEEIAARMVEERNMSRINIYIKNGDLKGLEIMKKAI